jgi:prepilin-type N-terminal cleavage/methylation domain-containing protein
MKTQKSLGFTLIELLVVIAVLGILAAGLLATVDPLEQMKKGRDTTTRNTVVEIYNAVIRFNANKGKMPWDAAASLANCTNANSSIAATQIGAQAPWACISALVDEGELKSQFLKAAQAATDKIWIFGASEIASICFRPESKAIRADPATRFSNDLTSSPNGCPSTNPNVTCYWCAQ